MTWSEIKQTLSAMEPSLFGSVVNVETQLPLLAYLANMRIAGNAHKFHSLMRLGTVTLNGSGSYNLATLTPDLQQVYQLYDDAVPGREMGNRSLDEFNVNRGGFRFSFIAKTMKVSDDPGSGTLQMPYFSNYLVADAAGVRKAKFTDDTDVSVLYDDQIPLLIEGIMDYARRRDKKSNDRTVRLFDGRVASVNAFQAELENAVLNDTPVNRTYWDYRFLPG